MNCKRRLHVANAYLAWLAVGFLPEPLVSALGTEQCTRWEIFLNLFLAGGVNEPGVDGFFVLFFFSFFLKLLKSSVIKRN